ncbi:MAG: hypothetical protein JW763_07460 [candidate division Zixibacteria bacterium]|nr:hypothetical protein [candidate division Zixibacteria bacterium]
MRAGKCIILALGWLIGLMGVADALPPVEGRVFGIYPISNEVSFYKNIDDNGDNRGWTMQIVSINGFKVATSFNFEFTGDFNWDMSSENYDYYIELSLVKPITWGLSFNIQRIEATFEDRGINQVGLRFSF